MASKIKVLSEDVANKIAAGEVIERPASVVKELVENAIDAGSTSIWIEVNGGGRQLIRVADDGEGMSQEGAVLAFQRYSTSKISAVEDLEAITTLGFRGEALPSIAVVSRLELTTKEATALSGTRVAVEGGMVKEIGQVGRPAGTTVSVKQLFYNTPARRKFLKSAGTELRRIARAITALAVAHPEIAFHLAHDGSETFSFPRTEDLRQRLEDVYGKRLMEQTVPLRYRTKGLGVFGWLGKPEVARSSRVYQLTYVNRRPISSRAINHAIFEGYRPLLPKDKFPLAIVFLEIDSRKMDVNVHPTKREVRFSGEKQVHDSVALAIVRALRELKATPQVSIGQPDIPVEKEPAGRKGEIQRATFEKGGLETLEGEPLPKHKATFWQLHGCYILAQIKDGLVIIDQHAAHERIIYEAALESLSTKPTTGQQLLFPLTVELSFEQMSVVEETLPLFRQLGFGIRPFGRSTVIIDAVPTFIKRIDEGDVFLKILDELIEQGWVASDIEGKLAASLACKAAVKNGDTLTEEEMNHLIDGLFATEQPFSCPHGRPTLIRMPLAELDRKLGR